MTEYAVSWAYIMILTSTSSSESNDHRVCQEKCVNYLISSFTNVNSHPISPLLKAKAEHALALDFFVFLLICSDICCFDHGLLVDHHWKNKDQDKAEPSMVFPSLIFQIIAAIIA